MQKSTVLKQLYLYNCDRINLLVAGYNLNEEIAVK